MGRKEGSGGEERRKSLGGKERRKSLGGREQRVGGVLMHSLALFILCKQEGERGDGYVL